MRTLTLLALSAKALGQAPGATIVVAPPDVQCPTMSALGADTYLSTDPWSLGRTVHVKRKSTGAADVEIAVIAAALSLNAEYELKDPVDHKVIAKLVNPLFFWDTQQDIYNCQGLKLGSVVSEFKLVEFMTNAFMGRYSPHKVLDAAGQPVATLREEDETTKEGGFLGSAQKYIYMQDNVGTPLASMRHPTGGWKLGPFGEHLDVQVELQAVNPGANGPAMDPEFLSLVFANSLASGSRFSPGVGAIIKAVLTLILLVLICRRCCSKSSAGKAQAALEEKESLLATRVNSNASAEEKVEQKGRDVWACCSRRVQPK